MTNLSGYLVAAAWDDCECPLRFLPTEADALEYAHSVTREEAREAERGIVGKYPLSIDAVEIMILEFSAGVPVGTWRVVRVIE